MGSTLSTPSSCVISNVSPTLTAPNLCISALGIKVGNHFGDKYKSKAELAGGIILICLGLKILIEDKFF